MCKFLDNLFTATPEDVGEWSVKSYDEVALIFANVGIRIGQRDDYYWFVDEDTWVTWLTEAHQTAPSYKAVTATQRGFDCDKFARHLCDHVATKYEANGCFEVWGQTSFGGHAWNVLLTPSGAFEVEPQECQIWPLGTNPDYRIETVYHCD